MLENLRRNNISNNREKPKKTMGFLYLGRSWSMSWHNLIQNNTNHNLSTYQQHLPLLNIENKYPMRDSGSITSTYFCRRNLRCLPTLRYQANNFMCIYSLLLYMLDWLDTVPLCLSGCKTDDLKKFNWLPHFRQTPLE